MNCEQLREHYELYAIGMAEEPERSEIREHLNRGCEVCMAELKRARELAAIIEGSAALVEPSPKLRRRILASAGVEPRRLGWWAPFWAVAAICAIFAAGFFNSREKELGAQLVRTHEQVREQTIELTRLNEAFAILNGPDTTEASFGGSQPQPPKGKVFVNPSQGVLLMASNLPPARSGKIYEMWIIPKGGKPVPAGLFQSAMEGTALYVRRGAVDVNATGAVAVTLENEGGAPQPTSEPIIVAAIPSRGPRAQ
jgi:Anti-sigma-K factor rskA, C-terminal